MPVHIDKASTAFRIGVTQWLPESRFQALLAVLDRYPGITEELAFFTSATHPPLPLDEIARRADLLKQRMADARAHGYRAGINVLSTLGHLDENLPHSLQGALTPLTDIHGNRCGGSFCPNDPAMQEYITALYTRVAHADPEFIWIDDDVRLEGHAPLRYACFCDRCLEAFAAEGCAHYTRETLLAAFNEGTRAEKAAVRAAWLRFNSLTISRLLSQIEGVVHAIHPGLPLGLMTGERFYEGNDFDVWAEILSGDEEAPVRWRPGGGFYEDSAPRGLLDKAHAIGRQVSLLPENVAIIQSEIENFPYQRLKKSARVTALEAAAYIAAGCTGTAYNVLSMQDEPLDEYELLLARLLDARPFHDSLARAQGRVAPTGICTGWSKNSLVANNLTGGDWLQWGSAMRGVGGTAAEILEIGLPAAYSPDQAAVTVLAGDIVLGLSPDEIRRALSKAVYLDGEALQHINELGYDELTGFGVERWVDVDCQERFTADPLNGAFAGRMRDGRQSFWKRSAAMLRPAPGARILAEAVDYAGDVLGACCQGVFENALGGRVAVAGYYPWEFLQNLSKTAQLKNLFRWLSGDTLPGWVSSFHKAALWIREPEGGKPVAALLNASLDPAESVRVMLRTGEDSLRVTDMHCRTQTVTAVGQDGPYREFILPSIEPWEMRFLQVGK